MPLDSKAVDELKGQIAASRKRPLNFGLCLGKTPEETAFVLHRTLSPTSLALQAKSAAKTTKTTSGTIETEGKIVSLKCADEPPAGVAAKMNKFFKSLKLTMKVRILDANGTLLEEDGEVDPTETDDTELEERDGVEDLEWQQLKKMLEPRIALALSLNNADTSAIRTRWGVAQEAADETDFVKAVEIAKRIIPLLDQAVPSATTAPVEGQPVTSDAEKWRASAAKIGPVVDAVLASGKGDTGKIRGVWAYAQGKADGKDFAAALASLKPLIALLGDAQAASKTEAQTEVPKGAATSRISGAALMEEFKTRLPVYKDAFDTLPERAGEGGTLAKSIPGLVQANDLDTARVTLTKLDVIVKEAERYKLENAAAKLRVEPLVTDYAQRHVALTAVILPAVPGVAELRKAFTDAQIAVKAETDKTRFIAAEPLVDPMKSAIEALEARRVEFDKDKAEYLLEFGGISDDLDRTLKIGSVTPEMGKMRKALLAQKRIVDAAAGVEDYKTATPALLILADRLAKIDKAKDVYDEEKAAWEKNYPAARQKIATVEGCGAINPTLDKLKADFDLAVAAARIEAGVNEYGKASRKLAEALVHAETFIVEKGKLDSVKSGEFAEARKEGAKGIPVFSGPALDNGATIEGVELAMEGNKDLKTSKGLIALVAESKLLDGLFKTAYHGTSADASANVKASIEKIFLKIAAYQKDHKSDSRSKEDREKFAQAAALDMHHRLQISQLDALIPMQRKFEAIDVKALAKSDDQALQTLGWLDGILASDAMPALKAAVKAKRLELVSAMMAAAPNRDGMRKVADMAGPEFKASFERQDALGPLDATAKGGKARENHASTKIQNIAGAENIDQSRLLAGRLIADDGSFEVAALYAFDPKDLADDKPASRQMARALTRLKESPEAMAELESIPAPKPGSSAERLIRATLGLPKDAVVTAADARKSALSSLLAELRQGDVGSCFGTQFAIKVHDTDPKAYLKDIKQMMAEGKLTRIVGGQEVTVNIQTKMSDAELKDEAVKLTRGATPDLTGSAQGGRLATPAKLEEAPALKGAMAALGIEGKDATKAMNDALVDMQASKAFKKNQNEKAIRAAVEEITDDDMREQVLVLALAKVTDDPASVKLALTAAMANPDPATLPPAPVDLAEQGNATGAYDALLNAPDFDVEPNLVVEALIRGKLGLTEADVDRAEANEKRRAEIMTHPDMKSAKKLARPADDVLLDMLQKLEDEDKAIDYVKIRQLEPMKQEAFDSYMGEDQNRMLRAYEYTLTALAEKTESGKVMDDVNEALMDLVNKKMDALADTIVNDPGFKKTKVKKADVNEITTKLMEAYQRVFAKGTSAGYDASVGTALANDGSSDRGVWCLFDTQGIDDPDRWIKIDNAKLYGNLVQGMMMLAWSEVYGKAKDDKITKLSRRIADDLSETLISEGFAKKMAKRAKQAEKDDTVEPWQIGGGGTSAAMFETAGERPPVVEWLGNPTDAKDLLKKTGGRLKTLWDDPTSGLKEDAALNGETSLVATRVVGSHAFSLLPGEPKLKSLLEDPRGFDTAVEDHLLVEKAKWDDAQTGTMLRNEGEVADQLRLIPGYNNLDGEAPDVWNTIKGNPTMAAFTNAVRTILETWNSSATTAEANAVLSKHLITNLIPPVPAADLDKKLAKVAKALNVPSDLEAVVVKAAKEELIKLDAAKASMTDIKTQIAAAMAAEGIDVAGVSQINVNAALREPPGIVMADLNWGDAEHHTKFVMVVNPVSGKMEMWQMNEDGSDASRPDEDEWVTSEWAVVT